LHVALSRGSFSFSAFSFLLRGLSCIFLFCSRGRFCIYIPVWGVILHLLSVQGVILHFSLLSRGSFYALIPVQKVILHVHSCSGDHLALLSMSRGFFCVYSCPGGEILNSQLSRGYFQEYSDVQGAKQPLWSALTTPKHPTPESLYGTIPNCLSCTLFMLCVCVYVYMCLYVGHTLVGRPES